MAARPRDNLLWFTYYWIPVIIFAGFIFSSSSIPGKNIPSLFPLQDILYHAAVYGILALFFLRALGNTGRRKTIVQLVGYTVLFCFLYGVSDELHQLATPGRTCDIFDLFVDTAGSFIGAGAGGLYLKWRS